MWAATLDGRVLHFRLVGINDQNFLMRDEETGSWWQQVTGEAIAGPLRGKHLLQVAYDELTLATFRAEQPGGRLLQPAPEFEKKYAGPDWEKRLAKLPTVTPRDPSDLLAPRDLVVGVSLPGEDRAYPMAELLESGGLADGPVLIVVAGDGRSLRAFSRSVDGQLLDLRPVHGTVVDGAGGRIWEFSGEPRGPGAPLGRVPFLIDYWFDWKKYHPATRVGITPG